METARFNVIKKNVPIFYDQKKDEFPKWWPLMKAYGNMVEKLRRGMSKTKNAAVELVNQLDYTVTSKQR